MVPATRLPVRPVHAEPKWSQRETLGRLGLEVRRPQTGCKAHAVPDCTRHFVGMSVAEVKFMARISDGENRSLICHAKLFSGRGGLASPRESKSKQCIWTHPSALKNGCGIP